MGRKLIINSNNEITYNTIEGASREFKKIIKRVLDELRENFKDEEDIDSNSNI